MSLTPTLASAAACAGAAYLVDGVIAYPEIALAAAGSYLYDKYALGIMLTLKQPPKLARTITVFGAVALGSFLTMPMAPLQSRLLYAGSAAVGAYAASL